MVYIMMTYVPLVVMYLSMYSPTTPPRTHMGLWWGFDTPYCQKPHGGAVQSNTVLYYKDKVSI